MADYTTPYCLHCYAPLERFHGASHPCEACGAPNLHVDMQIFWTRERKLREWESFVKSLILIVMGVIAALALFNPGTGLGKGHGMAIGAPILLGVLLWDTASFTRRKHIFRGDIVWPIVGWILGPLLVASLLAAWSSTKHPLVLAFALLGGVIALAAIASPLLRRWGTAWREHRIADRQASFIS